MLTWRLVLILPPAIRGDIAAGGRWIQDLFPPLPLDYSCKFTVPPHNGVVLDKGDSARADACSKMRWVVPDATKTEFSFGRVDQLKMMQTFHNTTIYFVGDSTSTQNSVDFACRFSTFLVEHKVNYYKNNCRCSRGCQLNNHCIPHVRGGAGIEGFTATFRLDEHSLTLHSRRADTPLAPLMRHTLEMASPKDIVVLNSGLHVLDGPKLATMLDDINSTLIAAQHRGVLIYWRETTAAHFDTPTGYWEKSISDTQANQTAYCVNHSALDREGAWRMSTNGEVVPWMRRRGIFVLPTWAASFAFPGQCHVGMGKDCLHVLEPSGLLTLQTDLIMSALLEQYPTYA